MLILIYSQLSYIIGTIFKQDGGKSTWLFNSRKNLILANHEEAKSYSEIAGIVWRSKSVVYHVVSRFKADKTLEPKLRTGRPPMTTKREDRMIVKMSLKDHFALAMSNSCAFCEETGKPISRKSVSHGLNKEKLVAQIPCRKSLISKKNQKVHLDFATEHIMWTEEQWSMVHFSDESKFNFFGSDGKRFVRCKNGECLSPQCVKKTVKFRGGGANGVGDDFFSGNRTHCSFSRWYQCQYL